MHVAVTGGSGFVGRALIRSLIQAGHRVTALSRSGHKPDLLSDIADSDLQWLVGDVHALTPSVLTQLAAADVMAHLAWDGLPNYHSLHHLDRVLPGEMTFLRRLVEGGAKRVMVTGTCFEYGLQDGAIAEDAPVQPVTAYGMAKDGVRRYLIALQRHIPFTLQWVRLFYLHGPGQNPNSLLSQLDAALARGEQTFPMSQGEQLRDYLAVDQAAEHLRCVIETPAFDGIVNVGSGCPISVRTVVENHLKLKEKSIHLERGRYPYPDYEPLAFWANVTKFKGLIAHNTDNQ
jgi:dTDP-6-deoxy-L-talose 4-dehydrogenase (NAD+)